MKFCFNTRIYAVLFCNNLFILNSIAIAPTQYTQLAVAATLNDVIARREKVA